MFSDIWILFISIPKYILTYFCCQEINSLFVKLEQKSNRTKTKFLSSQNELEDTFFSNDEIENIICLNEHCCQIEVFVALWRKFCHLTVRVLPPCDASFATLKNRVQYKSLLHFLRGRGVCEEVFPRTACCSQK